MAKKKSSKEDSSAASPPVLSPTARAVISGVLILHLVVVVATPWSVRPGSSLAHRILRYTAPYVEAGNISSGYAFFAPDPGPAHIIEYELEFADGRSEQGKFPDLQEHWPRLRYHRHFMLTEQLADGYSEEPPPPTDPRFLEEYKQVHAQWTDEKRRFDQRANSYAQHLLNAHGAQRVEMRLVEHRLPTPQQVLGGLSLRDRSLYDTGPVIIVTAKERP